MSRLFRGTGGTNSFDVRNENGRMRFGKRFGDEKLLSVLLDDISLRKVGDFVEIKGEKWEVIWRKVGSNFGIEFGLRSRSGKIISDVFYD